jgi:anti-anti-sigma factor
MHPRSDRLDPAPRDQPRSTRKELYLMTRQALASAADPHTGGGDDAAKNASTMHTLVLTGELDRTSALTLEAAIERLCENGIGGITLDLRELAHIDSTGVAVIAFRCICCRRQGREFALVAGPWYIQRPFALAGLAESLPFVQGDAEPRAAIATASSSRGAIASRQRVANPGVGEAARRSAASARRDGPLSIARGPAQEH